MQYMRLMPEECLCSIMYWESNRPSYSYTIAAAPLKALWSSYASWLVANQKPQVGATYDSIPYANLLLGYFALTPQPGDQPMPLPQDLISEFEFPTHREKIPNFKKRLLAGEVLMADYRVGRATIQRSAGYDLASGTVSTTISRGWLYPPFKNQPYSEPTYGKRLPSDTVRRVDVILKYEICNVPNAAPKLSPIPTFLNVDYGVDKGLVTETLAARNDGTFDLLTELAELPETLAFITDTTNRALLKTEELELEARGKRKLLNPEKFARFLSSHWLKGRYALLPIFYSLNDMSETLRQMGREYAEFKNKVSLDSPIPVIADGVNLVVTTGDTTTHRCFIRSRYSPDTLLSDLRRLIKINLASTAWELTTLSFVVDWAVNIGDYLSAATGDDGSNESKCCYSVKDDRTLYLSYKTGVTSVDNLKTVILLNTYVRSVINPVDHIGLSLGLDLNWKRYIDAAALSLNPIIKRLRSLK